MQDHLTISKNDNVESGAGTIVSVAVLDPVTGDSAVSNHDLLTGSNIENLARFSTGPSVDANTNPCSPKSEILPHALKSQPEDLPIRNTSHPSEDHLRSMPRFSSIIPPFVPEWIYEEHERILKIVAERMEARKKDPQFMTSPSELSTVVFAFVPASIAKD
ncbi:MAG: hypothetical protein ABSE46_01820 [Terracidiphilus sp.]|jgi:hypothetical protein